MFTAERIAKYSDRNYPPDLVSALAKLSVDDRRALFSIATGCLCGNQESLKAFEKILPIKGSMLIYSLTETICADDITDAELDVIAKSAEHQLQQMAEYPNGMSEATAHRLTKRASSIVAALRLQRGMTQAALAKEAQINIRQLQKIEAMQISLSNVTLKNAIGLANALGVTVEYLYEQQGYTAKTMPTEE